MAKTANFQKKFPTDTLHQGRVDQGKQAKSSVSGMVEAREGGEDVLSEKAEKRNIGAAAFQRVEAAEGDKRFAK